MLHVRYILRNHYRLLPFQREICIEPFILFRLNNCDCILILNIKILNLIVLFIINIKKISNKRWKQWAFSRSYISYYAHEFSFFLFPNLNFLKLQIVVLFVIKLFNSPHFTKVFHLLYQHQFLKLFCFLKFPYDFPNFSYHIFFFQPPMKHCPISNLNSHIIRMVNVINRFLNFVILLIFNHLHINFIAKQEFLNSFHSNCKFNELTNKHWQSSNWRINHLKYCDNRICNC